MGKIDVDIVIAKQDDIAAYGTVTIDRLLRFQVQLKYFEENGEKRMFLSYPSKKINEKWEDVVHPHSDMREEIQKEVITAAKKEIQKELNLPDIVVNEVIPIIPDEKIKVPIIGVANIEIFGIKITGITIKRGLKGLFVNMPQYKYRDGTYRDLVYAMSAALQEKIEREILYVYNDIVQRRYEK